MPLEDNARCFLISFLNFTIYWSRFVHNFNIIKLMFGSFINFQGKIHGFPCPCPVPHVETSQPDRKNKLKHGIFEYLFLKLAVHLQLKACIYLPKNLDLFANFFFKFQVGLCLPKVMECMIMKIPLLKRNMSIHFITT